MDVSLLDSADPTCARFAECMDGARLCHMPTWNNMLEKTLGYPGYYLVAREDGQIRGVLSLMYVRSRLFGRRLVSQPFSDYGGPLALGPDAIAALYDRATDLAMQLGCESILFRNTVPLPQDLYTRTDKVSMYLPLSPNPQDVWKSLRHKTRNRVRKAEREGLTVTSGGEELLDEFYRVWTIRMRELGTPCYPRRLFSGILHTFPSTSRIFLAALNGVTTAVLFVYTFNGWVQCSWGAARRDYDGLGPNYILNWKAIEYYCQKGMKWYDFGRSTIGSGQHIFKQRWGAFPIKLCWQYWSPAGRDLHIVKPDDPRYGRKKEIWRNLPLTVTRVLGPRISCGLP